VTPGQRREKKTALDLALRTAVDADLARARSQEAVASAEVAQRKAEIADLQAQIGAEGRR
jgi:Arc/MetJ family transcription regulator